MYRRPRLPWIVFLLLILFPALASAGAIPRLQAPPIGEQWYSIIMDQDRVGFAHLRITATADGYEFFSEGSLKLRVMGFSRESTARESFRVGKDLALQSFAVEQTIDGSPMRLQGTATAKGIRMTTTTAGGAKEKTLKTKGKVVPSPALNIYPLMQGAAAGKKYTVQMFDPEAGKVKGVKIEVIGAETLDGRETVHLQNDLFPMVDNDIWVDTAGNTIKESVRDGLVVTRAEDAATANRLIAEDALAKRDMIFDFSLIKPDVPLQHPEGLRKLVIAFTGFPPMMPLFQGRGQVAERMPDGIVRFQLQRVPIQPAPPAQPDTASLAPFLGSSDRITPDDPAVVAKAGEITGEEREPLRVMEKLVRWVANSIKGSVTDVHTPVETMKKGSGNCQAHARLYASLARARGIPTRFVSGLTYMPGKGFLYHSWAESYVGEWLPVDPTFGQMPVDVTHIKLVEGDSPEDLALLAGVVGKLKAAIIEQQ